MRQLVITVPAHLRRAADVDLEVLVSDYGDEGITADCRSTGGIWQPVELEEQPS